MYFVRTYKSGAPDYDPRQKEWAEFHCDVCGEDSDLEVTNRTSQFDFKRERMCPHCKQTNPEDRIKNIEAQINKLTKERKRIEVEIESLIKSLEKDNVQKEC